MKTNQGFALVSGLIFLGLFTGIAFSMLSLSMQFRQSVMTQFKLDACAGKTANDWKLAHRLLMSQNLEIEALRVQSRVATLAPDKKALVIARIKVIAGYQDISLGQWDLRRAHWLGFQGCMGLKLSKGDIAGMGSTFPLPDLGFDRFRGFDDAGPLPLRTSDSSGKKTIQVSRRGRVAAVILGEEIRWTKPRSVGEAF